MARGGKSSGEGTAKLERPTPKPLSHEDIDFLKALRHAADHAGATSAEAKALECFFRDSCGERGLEPDTIALAIEALC